MENRRNDISSAVRGWTVDTVIDTNRFVKNIYVPQCPKRMQWSISEDKIGAGVLIRTLRRADDSKVEPKVGDIVKVHCETSLDNGTRVDSTRERNRPLEFKVGSGDVIKGLEVAVQRLSVGKLVEVTIPYIYAYGMRGRMPEIPPAATLVMKVELLEIIPKA